MSNTTDIPAPEANRVTALIGSFHKVEGAWSGTSYGYHPHGVVRRGIIFTDHHNVSGSHDAKVILEPESGLIFPPNDSESSRCGSPNKACLRPKSGGTVEVYRNGQWVGPDGPWKKLICDILDELELEVTALKAAEKAKVEKQKQDSQRETDEPYRLAAAALNLATHP